MKELKTTIPRFPSCQICPRFFNAICIKYTFITLKMCLVITPRVRHNPSNILTILEIFTSKTIKSCLLLSSIFKIKD
jgi:hypothetical protein